MGGTAQMPPRGGAKAIYTRLSPKGQRASHSIGSQLGRRLAAQEARICRYEAHDGDPMTMRAIAAPQLGTDGFPGVLPIALGCQ
jgi:hypothetical protein